MDADDRLRLDYDQTAQHLRAITDVRFKLLAFVPTVAGTAVGLLGGPRPAAELVGVGAIGLVATLGIFAFDLRNVRHQEALQRRAAELERRLDLATIAGAGGPFSFLAGIRGGPGLALVYAAAIGGWTYLVVWGALRAIEIDGARSVGAVLGVLAGVALAVVVERRAATAR